MEDFFKSPLALFDRANEHVNEYRRIIEEIVPHFEYEEKIFVDEVTQENLYAIQISDDIDLLSIGCVAFDAISCLRSVMDQVVFAASCVIKKSDNPNRTKFPFGEAEHDARKQFEAVGKNRGAASGVPAELHNVLISFEPFKGGRYGLWEFNSIRNTGIHRVIAPSAVAVVRPVQFNNGVMGSIKFVNEWDSSKRQAVFLREKDNYFADISYQITGIDISFGASTELPGKSVLSALDHLSSITLEIIESVKHETKKIVEALP